MAKKAVAQVKLQIKPGQAKPAPPIGPALGQHGVNIMEFCKAFNAQTGGMDPELPVPAFITIYVDRTFSFELGKPPASALLKKALGLKKGSQKPNSEKVGKITRAQLESIVKEKEADLSGASLEACVRTIAGTARSMGIEVEEV